jgi:TPR repeat protein
MNQAVTQFRKAADRGYAPAQAIMGLHYLFHNSAERLAYIQNLRKDVDISEATTMWNIGKSEYDNCRRAGRENCHDPEAPPR